MNVAFVFDQALGAYNLGRGHPLRPERVLRTVALIEAYGLVAENQLRRVAPKRASTDDLLRVHDLEYVHVVMQASEKGELWPPQRGIGPGDTPAFPDMHDAAALVAGATTTAVRSVLDGSFTRAFSPAGGLHHAHRDRAAGFCVYNDPAVAIAAARAEDPTLRVLYLDVDAHHGDGVQEAFYEEPQVLTISIHEDGRYLYPGTGSLRERGTGAGEGSAINVPLPPYATPHCFLLAFDEVVVPAARAFGPDLIVAQCGADAHWSDPLTSLGMTLPGFDQLFGRIVRLADDMCGGRLVACGGGGYSWEHVVPRAWTLLAAALVGRRLPEDLPASWRAQLGAEVPHGLLDDPAPPLPNGLVEDELLRDTQWVIGQLHEYGVPAR